MIPFEEKMSRGGGAAIEEASRFFMKQGPVHEALRRIAIKLEELKIAYAVARGMALVAHGYDRTETRIGDDQSRTIERFGRCTGTNPRAAIAAGIWGKAQ